MTKLHTSETVPEPDQELPLESLSTSTLTKAQLAEALLEQIGMSRREAKEVVDVFFDIIAGQLIEASNDVQTDDDADGDIAQVKIAGFGNFRVRQKNPRPGRNPRTGEPVPIAARRVITFHTSLKLRARIQGDVVLEDEDEDETLSGRTEQTVSADAVPSTDCGA